MLCLVVTDSQSYTASLVVWTPKHDWSAFHMQTELSTTQRPQTPVSIPLPSGQNHDEHPQQPKTRTVGGAYRLGLAYGRLIYQLRWLVVALWVGALVASIPFASQLTSALQSGGYSYDGSEAAQANITLTNTLHWPASQAVVVFQSSVTLVSDPAYQQEIHHFMGLARGVPHVTGVSLGSIGHDGKTTYVLVNFNQSGSVMQQSMTSFHKLLPTTGPARVYVTGEPETFLEYNQATQRDIEHIETVTLPIALVVLLIVFGALIAALMPLVLALVAVPVALALLYIVALHTWTSIFVLNVATIVGLGISIDYSLFMTRRFREELVKGVGLREAVAWSVATTGEAILFSGLTVMIGFCGLFLIGIPFMTSFGIGGALTVAAAVLAALTLLPALLGILGPRINALRLPLVSRLTIPQPATDGAQDGEQRGFWHGWALAVMSRPVMTLLA